MSDHPLRIAFTHMPGKRWTAGLHYLQNLFAALHILPEAQQPDICLLVASNTQSDGYACLKPYLHSILYEPTPSYWQRQKKRIMKRLKIWKMSEPQLSSYLRDRNVCALFGKTRDVGPNFAVPWLTWIPDFQHLHFPHMFSKEACASRTKRFTSLARHADMVILSSQHARNDFINFAPNAAEKARVLSFVAQIPNSIYDTDPRKICQIYNLPERFIYLPNQFWKHKNHGIVLDALVQLKDQYPEITVVCTGNTNEYRDPLYFAHVMARVSKLGLRDKFIVLGFVPHEHLFLLMRQSLAVLQPSLFEGWSTVVEEVKSLGKSILLSDIPVHREQDPNHAMFFDPQDPDSLAEGLMKVYTNKTPGPDKELEDQAQEQLKKRTHEFGCAFMRIIQEICQ